MSFRNVSVVKFHIIFHKFTSSYKSVVLKKFRKQEFYNCKKIRKKLICIHKNQRIYFAWMKNMVSWLFCEKFL